MNPAVVIDVGTGCTKLGFSGNIEPQSIIPTCVANPVRRGGGVHISGAQGSAVSDTDFYIGDEAYQRKDLPMYLLSNPVTKGRIDNWDDMERFFHQALFRNLRCMPEEHDFLLTEPPFNTPENREQTAEIMFETFNVKGLYIGVQAVLALYAQWVMDVKVEGGEVATRPDLTGLVVDAGDGLTQVVPVADGFVIASCIQEIPLGGRHVTQYISEQLCERGEKVPPEQRLEAARQIKEQHSYVCGDTTEEQLKFDQDPRKCKTFSGRVPKTQEAWAVQMGYERFMGPEMFFNPSKFSDVVRTPLPAVVDNCVLQCPIDYRRKLYGHIILAGGSSAFPRMKERLQRDVQVIVDNRLQQFQATSGGTQPQAINVQVRGSRKRSQQRYAAWLGGSLFATEPQFESSIKAKKEYDEVGPQCLRGSPVLLC